MVRHCSYGQIGFFLRGYKAFVKILGEALTAVEIKKSQGKTPLGGGGGVPYILPTNPKLSSHPLAQSWAARLKSNHSLRPQKHHVTLWAAYQPTGLVILVIKQAPEAKLLLAPGLRHYASGCTDLNLTLGPSGLFYATAASFFVQWQMPSNLS